MLGLWSAVAVALGAPNADGLVGDPQPGVLAFSAQPGGETWNPTRAHVETRGVATVVGMPFSGSLVEYGGDVRGRIATGRLVVDGRFGALQSEDCLGFRCDYGGQVDGAVRLGVAVVDGSRVRVVPYIGTGTVSELGLAFWWRSPDGRFEFDFAGGAAVSSRELFPFEPNSWAEISDGPVSFVYEESRMLPEMGLTLHIDGAGAHHVRFGHFGPIPTLTWRSDPGRIAIELTAGAAVMGALVTGSFGGTF